MTSTAVAARGSRRQAPGTSSGPADGSTSGKQAGAATTTSSSACTAVLDHYSHPLVVPSDRAFAALLVVPLLVWWAAVLAGVWVYEGLPKGQKVYHLMIWFDKGVLRPAGGLVPFVVVGVRAAVHVGAHAWRAAQGGGGAAAARAAARGEARLQLGSLLLSCGTIYAAMAAARLGIYLTHYFLLSRRYLEFHLVSDHIFLAATMLICLHTEVVCLLSDMLRLEQAAAARMQGTSGSGSGYAEGVSLPGVALTALFVVALFLYLFTAADMYYTAKYYHFPLESLATMVIVFLLFQGPMLLWLVRRRQRAQRLSA